MKVKIECLRRVSQAAGINTAFLKSLFVTTNAVCVWNETWVFILFYIVQRIASQIIISKTHHNMINIM